MFTGLIQSVGCVVSQQKSDIGLRLTLSCQRWSQVPGIGASICVSGCCLTVTCAREKESEMLLEFDVVQETLNCTLLGSLQQGDQVNLEQSLRADSRMGGHFVQGHVDGVERVLAYESHDDGACCLRVSMEKIDPDTVVSKGSITIDGVSLTIAKVGTDWFEVALIPTTIQDTTLGKLSQGERVALETDILARTVVQTVRRMQSV